MVLSAERIRTVHCGWALPTMQRLSGDGATPVEAPGNPGSTREAHHQHPLRAGVHSHRQQGREPPPSKGPSFPERAGESQGDNHSVRRLIAGFFLVVISAVLTVAGASAANADLINNAPNLTVAGYGVAATTSVVCDPATHTMSVTGRTSVMLQPDSFGGYTNGPFDNGQYVRYSVWSRDVNGGAWAVNYSFGQWFAIKGVSSTPYVDRLMNVTDFNTYKLTGKAGHSYQALVQVDYRTGKTNVANIPSTYTQWIKKAGYSFPQEVNYCSL